MNLSQRDSKVIWHPYTQSGLFPHSIAITHGKGSLLFDENGKSYIDAIGSWWVNLHGHSHEKMNAAIAAQAAQLEQVIFAAFTHEPAITLAERLIALQPHFGKVFFSDNGSTAVEVALKIAIQYHQHKGEKKNKIVSFKSGYHGDTFGAMAVSGRDVFTAPFKNYLFEVIHIADPTEEQCLSDLQRALEGNDVAAFIAEPCILGSGGMLMYPPEKLETLFAMCRAHGALIIADEVMTGFGRTGTHFCCDQVRTKPDMACLSKGLTGGYLPMGVTMCTDEIHREFVAEDILRMLFHGHSFTANPLACAAANASLDILLEDKTQQNIQRITQAQARFVDAVNEAFPDCCARSMGVVAALNVHVPDAGYTSSLRQAAYHYFLPKGILIRPLGNVLYILPPYCITDEELDIVQKSLIAFVAQYHQKN